VFAKFLISGNIAEIKFKYHTVRQLINVNISGLQGESYGYNFIVAIIFKYVGAFS